MRRIVLIGAMSGGLVAAVAAGAMLFAPVIATAADPTASPAPAATTAPGTTPAPGASTAPNAGDPGRGGCHGPGGPFGGRNEAVSDASVVAKVIGISEADLTTALNGGQTIAAVAKAHGVDIQKVIDALVADSQSELDAAVKAGTITQAQADARKANLVQHATDQVNGTLRGHQPGG
jgi:hypothetical protein